MKDKYNQEIKQQQNTTNKSGMTIHQRNQTKTNPKTPKTKKSQQIP